MAGVRLLSKAKGFVHDIDTIKGLSDERTNVRILSDQALYILQNLANNDVRFETRYGVIVPGNLYVPIDSEGADFDQFVTTRDVVRRDLTDVTFITTLECMCDALTTIAANSSQTSDCGCTVGEGLDTEAAEEGGDVPPPVGSIEFQEPSEADDRKCKAANVIHFSARDAIDDLDQYPVETWTQYGLVFAIGVVVTILAAIATPAVALVVAIAGAISIFAGKLAIEGVSLGDIVAEMDANQDELVCTLYNSTDAATAKSDYLAILSALTAIELEIVGLLLPNASVDLLFFDTPESEAFWDTYTAPVDCGTACGEFVTHIGIRDTEGSPQGVIVGSDRFLVDDTVTVTSLEDRDCDPTSREAIVFEVLDATEDQQEVQLTTVLTTWSTFPLEGGCNPQSVYYGDDFTPVRAEFDRFTEPAVTAMSGVAIAALRSGGSFSVDITRIS